MGGRQRAMSGGEIAMYLTCASRLGHRYIISTLYTFSWDILVDWELQQRLRPDGRRMAFGHRWPYGVALVLDFFLRFLWTLTLTPTRVDGSTPFGSFVNATLAPMLPYFEIGRRSMWSLIRLEREHLTNSAGYRVVPLHFDNSPSHAAPVAEAPATLHERRCCCGYLSYNPKLLSTFLEIGGFVAVVVVCYVVSFVTASPSP